jgi:hypothetical protein
MGFLHKELDLSGENTVIVTVDRQANVMLLDDTAFQSYQRGRQFRYYGGLVKQSPFHVSPPHAGRWHLVIDLGGTSGTVRHSIRVV